MAIQSTSSSSSNQPYQIYTNCSNPAELNYICSTKNLKSILENGLLSHKRAHKLKEVKDLSDSGVQECRSNKCPKNAERDQCNKRPLKLHQYTNLFLQPYNNTLWRFLQEDSSLCVLRIHPKVLTKKETLISTRNAAAKSATFSNAHSFTFDLESSKILHLSKDYLIPWHLKKHGIHQDQKDANQIRQAEILVPHKVPPTYIKGIYVPDGKVQKTVLDIFKSLKINGKNDKVIIHPSLFYNDGREWHSLDSVGAPALSDTGVNSYETTSSESDSDKDVKGKKKSRT